MIFRPSFIEALTEDEHALLYYIVNENKTVIYELAYSRAGVIIDKLCKMNLTEEGEELKKNILEKYKTL
jgi:hypothetical protein